MYKEPRYTVELTRAELIQLSIVLANRIDELRKHIDSTDYMALYGDQAFAEQVAHDDARYAYELEQILASTLSPLN
jgi:hypothetical protein